MKSFAASREKIPMNSIREMMRIAETMSDVIQLQIGEPSADTPVHIRQAAIKAMEEGFTHYTANAGLATLREAISNRMKRDYAVDIPINRIIVTAGAVSALNLALLSLVEVGEEVLIPDPTYPNYESLVRMQGAIPVYYPTKAENRYVPDIADIERLITPFTKAIIVNSPSNPTGAVMTEEKWKELLQLAKQYELYIISDEIYDEIIFEGRHVCPLSIDPEVHDRVISIFGFSKVYAMTGWRLGYAIVPDTMFPLMCKLQEPVTTCASAISQKAGEAALNGPQTFVEETREFYRRNREMACNILDEYGMNFHKPDGAFYIPVDISDTGMGAKDFAVELLTSEKVLVSPCGAFGPSGKHLIRICFAGDAASIREGLQRLGRFYQDKMRS